MGQYEGGRVGVKNGPKTPTSFMDGPLTSGVFSTGAMGALAPAILGQSFTVTAL